ncbi:MAG TPA: hypothetical protein VII30_01205 [Gemmatimonadaceae bacterium]
MAGGLRNTVQITRDGDVTPPLTRECELLARCIAAQGRALFVE